jgi:hypothetical protein
LADPTFSMPSPSRAMQSVTEVVKAIVGGGEVDAGKCMCLAEVGL